MTNEQTGCLHPTTTLFVKRENDEITIPIVELKNDDLILGTDGQYHEHGGLKRRAFSGDMLKITMPDFTTMMVTPDHLMPTFPVGLKRSSELTTEDKLPYRATKHTNKIYYRKIYDITHFKHVGEVYDIAGVYKSFYILGSNLVAGMSDYNPKFYTMEVTVSGVDEHIDLTTTEIYYIISPLSIVEHGTEWTKYTEPVLIQEGYNVHLDVKVGPETGSVFNGWVDGESNILPRLFRRVSDDISVDAKIGYITYELEFDPSVPETGSFEYKLNDAEDWTLYENAVIVNVSDTLTVKAVPTTGYKFDGWVDDEDGTMTDTRTFANTLESGIYKAAFALIE